MKIELKIFITVILVLLFYISHFGGSYMADSSLATTQAIIDNGSFIIDSYVKDGCKMGGNFSLFGCDHALYNGHWYSGFAPGASFLALPVYAIFKPFTYLIPDTIFGYPKFQVQTIFLNILATILIIIPLSALLSVLLYKFSKSFVRDKKYRILSCLLFSFGTLFFYYSTKFDTRVLATFFSFAAFYILFKNRTKKVKSLWLFVAGLFAAIAVTTEYMQIIVAFILFAYLISFLRNIKIIHFIVGAIMPATLMFLYHFVTFGNMLVTSYSFRQGSDAGVANLSMFSSFNLFNLWSYTFSPKYGLFFYMPILLLGLYGLYLGFKEKRRFLREWLVIGFILLSYLIFICSFFSESPCTFGPRYLIVVIPFLCLPLGLALRKVGMLIGLIVGAISVFIDYLPALYVVGDTGCNPGLSMFKNFILQIPTKGLTNYTFNLINLKFIALNYVVINIISLIALCLIGFVLYKFWKN